MIFAKVDVSVPRHHRFLRIPKDNGVRAAAIGVWMTSLCYTRAEELDGFVPFEAIESIATETAITWLVSVGLLARAEHDGIHGFEVLKYAKHNETKAEIEERRAKDRNRKGRNFRPGPPGDSGGNPPAPVGGFPDSDSDSDSEISEGERERESGPTVGASESRIRPAIVNSTADGSFGLAVSAWADGIGKATGARFVPPRGGSAELGKLIDAMGAHAPPAEDRVEWARRTGEAYGRARKGDRLHAHGFLDWLNSGRPDRGATHPGTPDRNPYDSAAIRTERQRRDTELRNAVAEGIAPAPIGDLLKAVGGRPR
jgi:hypothetical protein